MKKIYKKIQKYFGRLSDLNDRHSSHARLIAFFLGIIVMGSVIWYTYQYFSTASRADNPVVTYVLKTDNCTTKKASSTCKIVGDVGDLIKVHMYLESTGTNKLSGADLIFKYNIGKEGQLSFVSQSSSTFNTTLVAETHDVGLLHLARVNNKNDANLNGAETFTLTFKIEKEGASRVALITSASTIVGPQTTEDGVYTLSPQNEIGPKSNIPADAWKNIYNIAVATNGDNDGDDNPRPTLTPGQTTPGSGTTLTPIQITSAPLPENLKDVDINFRLRFQGIVTQPKNSSPIIVKVKLVT
ncbi:hypothetical protein KBD81_05930, partial [Candidatus Woesebacteria bacterium]|nr:hypothetical protein [Candidatus Woesebacteria bacterium]